MGRRVAGEQDVAIGRRRRICQAGALSAPSPRDGSRGARRPHRCPRPRTAGPGTIGSPGTRRRSPPRRRATPRSRHARRPIRRPRPRESRSASCPESSLQADGRRRAGAAMGPERVDDVTATRQLGRGSSCHSRVAEMPTMRSPLARTSAARCSPSRSRGASSTVATPARCSLRVAASSSAAGGTARRTERTCSLRAIAGRRLSSNRAPPPGLTWGHHTSTSSPSAARSAATRSVRAASRTAAQSPMPEAPAVTVSFYSGVG